MFLKRLELMPETQPRSENTTDPEWPLDILKKCAPLNDYIPAGSLHPSIFHPQGEDSRLTMGVGQTHGYSWENLFVFPVHPRRESGTRCHAVK